MKSTFFIVIFILVGVITLNAQTIVSLDSASAHLKEQFNQYHQVSYDYKDDNCGGNIFIPSIYEGEIANTNVNEVFPDTTFGRSCTRIFLKPFASFSAVKYVYPENNIGTHQGYDMSGATSLSFKARGNGKVEFLLGGVNRRPFYSDTLPVQDGVDIRSSGFVTLSNNWQDYSIDLTNNRFWVYVDSTAGMNNKYCQPVYMDTFTNFHFRYGGDDGQGNTCMTLYWFGGNTTWAGVFLFPPEGDWTGTLGYNLSGITKIRFKAKISIPGNVKFLFGKNGDSGGQLTNIISLNTGWQWYEWNLPSGNYSNIVGGFGLYFGGDIGTPNYSTTCIDSVYYEGVELAHDFSNVIGGFNVSATKNLNPDSAVVYVDEMKYNKDRTSHFRFCQSYVCGSDPIDMTMKNRADVYDNALKLIVDLMLFNQEGTIGYLNDAKLVGDAFIYAMNHDRHFTDGRLRNSYMCGDLIHWNNTARIPGWWDYSVNTWFEDPGCVSTSTGNMAWAGIALTSLYQATLDNQYLNAAEAIADWCIDNTNSAFGFTGGFEGFDDAQTKVTWKSTEHNIDLYALFTRLFTITGLAKYDLAAQNAATFVQTMWVPAENHFWTGTDSTGINPNTSNIPLDIHAWYIMAFQDSTTNYSNGMNWAYQNCFLSNYQSINYPIPLIGFDFNPDKDGIWLEGSAQAALANSMKGNVNLYDSLLMSIEYVQSHHNHPHFYSFNHKGIVSADHDNTSTGFEWSYHNRLHIGATCWYILAKLKKNPYYYSGIVSVKNLTTHDNWLIIYPNPTNNKLTIEVRKPVNSIGIVISDIRGNIVRETNGTNYREHIDVSNLSRGIYFIRVFYDKIVEVKKLVID